MIRKQADDGWYMIPQALHAAIAGQLARWWHSPHFIPTIPRAEIEVATTFHDSGWALWDAAPPLNKDGLPMDFREINLDDTDGIWERGVERVAQKSLYAAVLVSLHASTIYQLRCDAGADTPAITQDRLKTQEQIRQDLLQQLDESGVYPDRLLSSEYLLRVYRILRTCDLLSLALCADELQAGEIPDIPTPNGGYATLKYRPIRHRVLHLEPYPFESRSMPVIITARHLQQTSFPDVKSYHAVLREAEIQQLYYHIVAKSD